MKLHERICLGCGKPYMSRNDRQKYCTYRCYIDTLDMSWDKRQSVVRRHRSGIEFAKNIKSIKEGLKALQGGEHE